MKSNGNYLNGRLAAVQAKQDGYDTALMLGQDGKVSEGPAMCWLWSMLWNGQGYLLSLRGMKMLRALWLKAHTAPQAPPVC
ncbi:hypothetical protein [Sulfitobacter sp.]|uniref:hypothetical protein n=1 Tax=Sulfitobacter sp. TaxID=1903071 RepID=UPI003FCDEFEE